MDAALAFAGVTISDERKVLIFIKGICLGEDRRYIMQQKCATLDKVYEAVIYLRQAKVLEEGMNWGGKGAQGMNRGDQEEARAGDEDEETEGGGQEEGLGGGQVPRVW